MRKLSVVSFCPVQRPVRIRTVDPNGVGARVGLQVGDDLLRINGRPVRDILDYQYLMAEGEVEIVVQRDGRTFVRSTEVWGRDGLGVTFEEMVVEECQNHCLFCFVDQLPPGLRPTLYVKDEDIRLSFLYGSYITLTSLKPQDLDRIVDQRLSPLYVSVHTTDPTVRRRIVGHRGAGKLLEQLRVLAAHRIELHTQIVLCPGINDGPYLERTVFDLADFFPWVRSIAIVPVGLTKHRAGLYPLRPVDPNEALELTRIISGWQEHFVAQFGVRLVHLADEWYLLAHVPLPQAETYDDFPQVESGVGLARQFLDTFEERQGELPAHVLHPITLTLVTGTLAESFICDIARQLERVDGLTVQVVVVPNRLLGETITVSGLLSGADIQTALEDHGYGDIVLLPPNCVNEKGLCLDDGTPERLSSALSVPVCVGSYDLVSTVLEVLSPPYRWG